MIEVEQQHTMEGDKPSRRYSWEGDRPFNDYAQWIKQKYGFRMQKISLDAGFTCPNRDGNLGRGGCTFCNGTSFRPGYCDPGLNFIEQVDKAINFFKPKYPGCGFVAYLQSYTNTYAPIQALKKIYEPILGHPEIKGLVIGTRPDCLSHAILDYLSKLNEDYEIVLEIGIESTLDRTLGRINRQHDYEASVAAIGQVHLRGLQTAAHLILGLPGENYEDMVSHAIRLSELPIQSLKLHQLQVLRGSVMAGQYIKNPSSFNLMTMEEYVNLLADFLTQLRPDISIERMSSQAPAHDLIAPVWGKKNFEITRLVEKALLETGRFQGMNYIPSLYL
ncbi:MAG: TIGR01212 family radical SAM protein [Cyclobacteriaceae bacterium]|nr:TIGR01212 family radical SAM protein [Cyclobacteriaceae bacterium]